MAPSVKSGVEYGLNFLVRARARVCVCTCGGWVWGRARGFMYGR